MCDSIYGTGNVLVMHCSGPFCKYIVRDMPTIDKNASSVPRLIHGKRPVSPGQLEKQLKKLVVAFPITTQCLFDSKNLIFMVVELV